SARSRGCRFGLTQTRETARHASYLVGGQRSLMKSTAAASPLSGRSSISSLHDLSPRYEAIVDPASNSDPTSRQAVRENRMLFVSPWLDRGRARSKCWCFFVPELSTTYGCPMRGRDCCRKR